MSQTRLNEIKDQIKQNYTSLSTLRQGIGAIKKSPDLDILLLNDLTLFYSELDRFFERVDTAQRNLSWPATPDEQAKVLQSAEKLNLEVKRKISNVLTFMETIINAVSNKKDSPITWSSIVEEVKKDIEKCGNKEKLEKLIQGLEKPEKVTFNYLCNLFLDIGFANENYIYALVSIIQHPENQNSKEILPKSAVYKNTLLDAAKTQLQKIEQSPPAPLKETQPIVTEPKQHAKQDIEKQQALDIENKINSLKNKLSAINQMKTIEVPGKEVEIAKINTQKNMFVDEAQTLIADYQSSAQPDLTSLTERATTLDKQGDEVIEAMDNFIKSNMPERELLVAEIQQQVAILEQNSKTMNAMNINIQENIPQIKDPTSKIKARANFLSQECSTFTSKVTKLIEKCKEINENTKESELNSLYIEIVDLDSLQEKLRDGMIQLGKEIAENRKREKERDEELNRRGIPKETEPGSPGKKSDQPNVTQIKQYNDLIKHIHTCGIDKRQNLYDFYFYLSKKENTFHWEGVQSFFNDIGFAPKDVIDQKFVNYMTVTRREDFLVQLKAQINKLDNTINSVIASLETALKQPIDPKNIRLFRKLTDTTQEIDISTFDNTLIEILKQVQPDIDMNNVKTLIDSNIYNRNKIASIAKANLAAHSTNAALKVINDISVELDSPQKLTFAAAKAEKLKAVIDLKGDKINDDPKYAILGELIEDPAMLQDIVQGNVPLDQFKAAAHQKLGALVTVAIPAALSIITHLGAREENVAKKKTLIQDLNDCRLSPTPVNFSRLVGEPTVKVLESAGLQEPFDVLRRAAEFQMLTLSTDVAHDAISNLPMNDISANQLTDFIQTTNEFFKTNKFDTADFRKPLGILINDPTIANLFDPKIASDNIHTLYKQASLRLEEIQFSQKLLLDSANKKLADAYGVAIGNIKKVSSEALLRTFIADVGNKNVIDYEKNLKNLNCTEDVAATIATALQQDPDGSFAPALLDSAQEQLNTVVYKSVLTDLQNFSPEKLKNIPLDTLISNFLPAHQNLSSTNPDFGAVSKSIKAVLGQVLPPPERFNNVNFDQTQVTQLGRAIRDLIQHRTILEIETKIESSTFNLKDWQNVLINIQANLQSGLKSLGLTNTQLQFVEGVPPVILSKCIDKLKNSATDYVIKLINDNKNLSLIDLQIIHHRIQPINGDTLKGALEPIGLSDKTYSKIFKDISSKDLDIPLILRILEQHILTAAPDVAINTRLALLPIEVLVKIGSQFKTITIPPQPDPATKNHLNIEIRNILASNGNGLPVTYLQGINLADDPNLFKNVYDKVKGEIKAKSITKITQNLASLSMDQLQNLCATLNTHYGNANLSDDVKKLYADNIREHLEGLVEKDYLTQEVLIDPALHSAVITRAEKFIKMIAPFEIKNALTNINDLDWLQTRNAAIKNIYSSGSPNINDEVRDALTFGDVLSDQLFRDVNLTDHDLRDSILRDIKDGIQREAHSKILAFLNDRNNPISTNHIEAVFDEATPLAQGRPGLASAALITALVNCGIPANLLRDVEFTHPYDHHARAILAAIQPRLAVPDALRKINACGDPKRLQKFIQASTPPDRRRQLNKIDNTVMQTLQDNEISGLIPHAQTQFHRVSLDEAKRIIRTGNHPLTQLDNLIQAQPAPQPPPAAGQQPPPPPPPSKADCQQALQDLGITGAIYDGLEDQDMTVLQQAARDEKRDRSVRQESGLGEPQLSAPMLVQLSKVESAFEEFQRAHNAYLRWDSSHPQADQKAVTVMTALRHQLDNLKRELEPFSTTMPLPNGHPLLNPMRSLAASLIDPAQLTPQNIENDAVERSLNSIRDNVDNLSPEVEKYALTSQQQGWLDTLKGKLSTPAPLALPQDRIDIERLINQLTAQPPAGLSPTHKLRTSLAELNNEIQNPSPGREDSIISRAKAVVKHFAPEYQPRQPAPYQPRLTDEQSEGLRKLQRAIYYDKTDPEILTILRPLVADIDPNHQVYGALQELQDALTEQPAPQPPRITTAKDNAKDAIRPFLGEVPTSGINQANKDLILGYLKDYQNALKAINKHPLSEMSNNQRRPLLKALYEASRSLEKSLSPDHHLYKSVLKSGTISRAVYNDINNKLTPKTIAGYEKDLDFAQKEIDGLFKVSDNILAKPNHVSLQTTYERTRSAADYAYWSVGKADKLDLALQQCRKTRDEIVVAMLKLAEEQERLLARYNYTNKRRLDEIHAELDALKRTYSKFQDTLWRYTPSKNRAIDRILYLGDKKSEVDTNKNLTDSQITGFIKDRLGLGAEHVPFLSLGSQSAATSDHVTPAFTEGVRYNFNDFKTTDNKDFNVISVQGVRNNVYQLKSYFDPTNVDKLRDKDYVQWAARELINYLSGKKGSSPIEIDGNQVPEKLMKAIVCLCEIYHKDYDNKIDPGYKPSIADKKLVEDILAVNREEIFKGKDLAGLGLKTKDVQKAELFTKTAPADLQPELEQQLSNHSRPRGGSYNG